MTTLLLGNGFSLAFDDKSFNYRNLYEAAEFPDRVCRVFDTVGTRDFEEVLRRLDHFHDLLPHYGADDRVSQEVRKDRTLVRNSLIQALQVHHPDNATVLSAQQRTSCATFLKHFDQVFTVNYDLLLYWIMSVDLKDAGFDDGFRGYRTLTWRNDDSVKQNVFYLHGGLHLWAEADATRKLYYKTNANILDQVRDQLNDGRYPLFVSEGESSQERSRIRQSAYLDHAYKALEDITATLVIYGMSLSPADQHIIDAIGGSHATELIIAYHDSASQTEIDRLKSLGDGMASRLKIKNGTSVPVITVPASTLFAWH